MLRSLSRSHWEPTAKHRHLGLSCRPQHGNLCPGDTGDNLFLRDWRHLDAVTSPPEIFQPPGQTPHCGGYVPDNAAMTNRSGGAVLKVHELNITSAGMPSERHCGRELRRRLCIQMSSPHIPSAFLHNLSHHQGVSTSTEYKGTVRRNFSHFATGRYRGPFFIFLDTKRIYANHITLGLKLRVGHTLNCLWPEVLSEEESDRPGRAQTAPSDEPLHAAFQPRWWRPSATTSIICRSLWTN